MEFASRRIINFTIASNQALIIRFLPWSYKPFALSLIILLIWENSILTREICTTNELKTDKFICNAKKYTLMRVFSKEGQTTSQDR